MSLVGHTHTHVYMATLNAPSTNVGDAPPDKGNIGAHVSGPVPVGRVWSPRVPFDPVVAGKFPNEQVTGGIWAGLLKMPCTQEL